MAKETEQTISVLENTALLLKKTQINLSKCPKERLAKVGYLQTRIKTIEEYWMIFKEAHKKLLTCTTREERGVLPYFVNEEFFIQEDLYLCMLGDLKDMLAAVESGKSKQSPPEDLQNKKVHLPAIHLPLFSGEYELWPSFKDLFSSLVHNCTTLSDVEKLHYLKTSVAGEAATLLKHIPVTSANYIQAWGTLNHRYGNKRLIVNALLKRLFAQKKCTSQAANQLKSLLDTTNEVIQSLQNLEVSTDTWDPVIIFLVAQKLDPESQKEWEQKSYSENSQDLSTWRDLRKFLEAKFRTLELVNPPTTTKLAKERVLHVTATQGPKQRSCALCTDAHTLCHCNVFTKMSPNERREHVKTNKLCFNCLGVGHSVFRCRLPTSCRVCKRRHHTLLHLPNYGEASASHVVANQPMSSNQANVEEREVQAMVASHYHAGQKQTISLLATAIVILKNERGHTIALKALIDSGSQACFISEKATQILKLHKTAVDLIVSGLESTKVRVRHEVNVNVLSRWNNFILPIKAYVMKKPLTSNIHSGTIIRRDWPQLAGIQLADETFSASCNIDLLLGVNEYVNIMKKGLIKGPPGTPCAQDTYLGWILMGGVDIKVKKHEQSLTVMKQEVDIEDLLKTIWEVDEDTKRNLTQREQLCEDIYTKTQKRDEYGRYVVKLPFNTEEPKSTEGNTREIAMKRLMQLERRFNQNKELKQEYKKVIEDYIYLKHIEEIPTEEINNKSVYLPHHAVIRNDKETTKTRVVFDASCKGSNGVSLNDELLTGPVLQDDLRNLIMRWRTHAVCFVADIQKMYRMIWVDREDTDYQRILWRNDQSEEVKDYRLLTVTFGTASAPYLAVRTLMKLAEDEGDRYPEAAKILREDFYVDDLMSGSDSLQQAIRNSQDLRALLHLGGFELKKWSSNSREFLETIDPSDRSSTANLDLKIDGTIKALGVQWNLRKDRFEYNLNLPSINEVITKRSILSDIQKLYDPLGWIAPSIVLTKILMQELWLEKITWDDSLNSKIASKWITLRSDLEHVNGIYIERWVGTTCANRESIELHGFSDASIQAYSAVVYCRVTYPDGTNKTTLIAARTRVAPLKTISLPRLELCGALILSRLLKQVGQAMRIPATQIYAWTDSSIVLSWLFGDPNNWKVFVANRVVEITTNVSCSQWHHVQTQDNPADVGSRGMLVQNLKKCELWWHGPDWLQQSKIQFTKPNIMQTDIDRKNNKIQNLKITYNKNEQEKRLLTQFEEFDTLLELLRTITYCRRFLKQKTLKDRIDSKITTEELHVSMQTCIKRTQEEEFTEDIESLKTKKRVKKSSKLKALDPYLDEDGILKVGGRLRNSKLANEVKHPIILGHASRLTYLVVAEAHLKTLHGGVQLMLTYLRSKYWILRAKSLVKQCIHRCLICARHGARVKTQLMGDLPSFRVKPARPFLNSGVDFAGPIQILIKKGRGAQTSKAYIAIFVCMSTKAIHLELVADLIF